MKKTTAAERLAAIHRALASIKATSDAAYVDAELHGDVGSSNAEYIAAMDRLEVIQGAVEEAAVAHVT